VTGLAVWLVVVGACDLVRATRDTTSAVRRGAIAGLGASLLVLAALVLELSGDGLLLLAGWVTTFLLWVLASASALGRRGPVARSLALVGLAGGLLLGLLADGGLETPSRQLPGPLGELDPELLLVVVGVGLVQLSTANVLVRLVLDAVGVPAAANEKKLKGGRLLGPMERLFLVGLGATGYLTAAAVVVAAKGLLRFPELQRDERAGPSDVTEYFLIGSFGSWLVALAGVGLIGLV
jgi:hypothetical protein